MKKRTRGRKPLSKEKQVKMKALLKEGKGYQEVADSIGVCVTTVFRYNKKWGL